MGADLVLARWIVNGEAIAFQHCNQGGEPMTTIFWRFAGHQLLLLWKQYCCPKLWFRGSLVAALWARAITIAQQTLSSYKHKQLYVKWGQATVACGQRGLSFMLAPLGAGVYIYLSINHFMWGDVRGQHITVISNMVIDQDGRLSIVWQISRHDGYLEMI